MKSKTPLINCQFNSFVGQVAGLFHMANNLLHKSSAIPVNVTPTHSEYLIPVDQVSLIDPALTKAIKSITFGYRKGAK